MNLDIIMKRRVRKLRMCILVFGFFSCYFGSFLVYNRDVIFDMVKIGDFYYLEGIELGSYSG